MRHILIISALLPLVLTGCSKSVRIEEVQLGMTVDEFLQLPMPHYFKSKSDNTVQYSCRLNAPKTEYTSARTTQPYIVTFEDGRLSEITLDKAEYLRRLGTQYNYGYGRGYQYADRDYYLYRYPYGR